MAGSTGTEETTALRQRVGAHVDQTDPVAAAQAIGADLAQFFLGDPQGWKKPTVAYPGGADGLRTAAEAADIELVVHAPYVLNVASQNNRIRIPSRKLLQQQVDLAAEVGAKGIVVHGGHVLASDDPAAGIDNWRKCVERLDVGEFGVGFTLDTCHAFSAGIELGDVVGRVTAITGRIDLVHANDSRDPFDSGADRHADLGEGTIGFESIAEVVRLAGCSAVLETPGAKNGAGSDIARLRAYLEAPAG